MPLIIIDKKFKKGYKKNEKSKKKITEKQKRAISLLLIGKTDKAIAEDLKISIMTLHRWEQLQEFQESLEEQRKKITEENLVNVSALYREALNIVKAHLSKNKDIRTALKVVLGFTKNYSGISNSKENTNVKNEDLASKIARVNPVSCRLVANE